MRDHRLRDKPYCSEQYDPQQELCQSDCSDPRDLAPHQFKRSDRANHYLCDPVGFLFHHTTHYRGTIDKGEQVDEDAADIADNIGGCLTGSSCRSAAILKAADMRNIRLLADGV